MEGEAGDRAAAAWQHQPGPRWDGPSFFYLRHPSTEVGAHPTLPRLRRRRRRLGCFPPRPRSARFVSACTLGGTDPSPGRLDRDHGPRPVPGVGPCPAAVSDFLPLPRVTFRSCQIGAHAHGAFPPSPSQVAAAGGRDSGAPGPERPGGKSWLPVTGFDSRAARECGWDAHCVLT